MTRLLIACLALVLFAASAEACHTRSLFRSRTVTRAVVVEAAPAAPKPPVIAPTAAPVAACSSATTVTVTRSGRIADFFGRFRPRSSARSGC
jgi:hypothetical protein